MHDGTRGERRTLHQPSHPSHPTSCGTPPSTLHHARPTSPPLHHARPTPQPCIMHDPPLHPCIMHDPPLHPASFTIHPSTLHHARPPPQPCIMHDPPPHPASCRTPRAMLSVTGMRTPKRSRGSPSTAAQQYGGTAIQSNHPPNAWGGPSRQQ